MNRNIVIANDYWAFIILLPLKDVIIQMVASVVVKMLSSKSNYVDYHAMNDFSVTTIND